MPPIASKLGRFASLFALLVVPVFATVITFDDNTTIPGIGRTDLVADGFFFPGGFLVSAASGGVPGSGQYVGSSPTDVSTGLTYLDMTGAFEGPFTLDSLDLAQLYPSDKLPYESANATLVWIRGFRFDGAVLQTYLQPAQNFVTYKFTGWTDLADVSFIGSIAGNDDVQLEPFFGVDNITVETAPEPGTAVLTGLALALLIAGGSQKLRRFLEPKAGKRETIGQAAV